MDNYTKYRYFENYGILLSKYYGSFDTNTFIEESIKILNDDAHTDIIKNGITDFRACDLYIDFNDMKRIHNALANNPKTLKFPWIVVVDKTRHSTLANLYELHESGKITNTILIPKTNWDDAVNYFNVSIPDPEKENIFE